MFFPPVGLHEDAVYLLEADFALAVADGFEQGADAEVADASEEAFGGADDERERVVGEGVVGQSAAVELVEDEGADVVGCEGLEVDGVGDAGAEVVVDGEAQFLDERGLGDEQEVVGLGEVFEQEPDFSETVDVHEVGVVDDGDELAAFGVDFPCGFDELFFSPGIAAFGFDAKGFAEDAERVGVGVQGAGYGGGDDALFVVLHERVLYDALAGAGFAHEQAEAALPGVYEQGVEDLLLLGEQAVFAGVEGVGFEAEVGSDHGISPLRFVLDG